MLDRSLLIHTFCQGSVVSTHQREWQEAMHYNLNFSNKILPMYIFPVKLEGTIFNNDFVVCFMALC